jgi:hypothetical protein
MSANKPQHCREQTITLADERTRSQIRSRQNPPELATTNRVIDRMRRGKR